jgi:hypothetical protein
VCELLFGNSKRNAEKAEAAAKLAASQCNPAALSQVQCRDEVVDLDDEGHPSADDEQLGHHIGASSLSLHLPSDINTGNVFLMPSTRGRAGRGGTAAPQGFAVGLRQSVDDIRDRLANMERVMLSLQASHQQQRICHPRSSSQDDEAKPEP